MIITLCFIAPWSRDRSNDHCFIIEFKNHLWQENRTTKNSWNLSKGSSNPSKWKCSSSACISFLSKNLFNPPRTTNGLLLNAEESNLWAELLQYKNLTFSSRQKPLVSGSYLHLMILSRDIHADKFSFSSLADTGPRGWELSFSFFEASLVEISTKELQSS